MRCFGGLAGGSSYEHLRLQCELRRAKNPRHGASEMNGRVSSRSLARDGAGPDGLAGRGSASWVQSVDRAARLLRAVADSGSQGASTVTLGETCRINRATAWRILSTLEAHGLVANDRGSG